jgi:acyl carrier protein
MFELLQEIVYKVTGKTGLTMDTDFVNDLELNSFDIMNIICAFEDRFDTEIPTRDVWQLHRVSDVLEYMQSRGITAP